VTELSAHEAVRATADPIHDVGSKFMLDPATFARAAEWGWSNPFAFYFSGRGGVLGDVDPAVVTAALGWFNPLVVSAMWTEGVAVHGAREAGRRYAEAAALWGREHLQGVDGLERFVELGEQLVAGADATGRPLFAAWRAEPGVDDPPGRALQLVHMLREWRGANHLVATTSVGLGPLEAILTNEGESQAKFFGWPEPFPDCSGIKDLHGEAEDLTDRLCAQAFKTTMTAAERGEFADAVAVIKTSAGL